MTGRLDGEVIIIGGEQPAPVSPATAPGADYERCSLSAMISPPGRPAGIMDCCTAAPLRGDRQRIRPRMHQ